jgi:hypothetical protein
LRWDVIENNYDLMMKYATDLPTRPSGPGGAPGHGSAPLAAHSGRVPTV